MRCKSIRPAATSSVAVAFENGDSLLLLHNLLRADELACLNVEVATALRCKREARSSFTRFGPRHDTDAQTDMHRRHRVRIPSEQMPVTANILCDALLVRVLALLENQIPELATSLFGECLPCTTCIGNTNFEHSRGEPAINVYTELGCLGAHEDQGRSYSYSRSPSIIGLNPRSVGRTRSGGRPQAKFRLSRE